MAEETGQADAVAPAKGGRRRRLALIAVLGLVLGGAGVWWSVGGLLPIQRGQAEAKPREPGTLLETRPGALQALEPFIANLADEDGKRYIRATLQLEFYDQTVPAMLDRRLPQIRDVLLTLLSSKSFAEIRTPQGKAVLREEIISRVNRVFEKDTVKAVYFTEFIVQ